MESLAHIVLGLTAPERWAATRRIGPHSVSQQWFVLIGMVVMLVLLVLLVAISYRRHQQAKTQKTEKFVEDALRRGLGGRERQILLAIALRSGLRHAYDIFSERDAFDRGAAQLLVECAETRTPPENESLKAEIARLREKLGFAILRHSEGIHSVNRRRFPRVAVRAGAWTAPFPLVHAAGAAGEAGPGAGGVPTFVASTVTELAGPGLRIETPLPVRVEDRILVVFGLAKETEGAPARPRTVAAVGRVRHVRDGTRGVAAPEAMDRAGDESPGSDSLISASPLLSIAVELVGLTDAEIDELASITEELSSPESQARGNDATGPEETPTYAMATTQRPGVERDG